MAAAYSNWSRMYISCAIYRTCEGAPFKFHFQSSKGDAPVFDVTVRGKIVGS